MTPEKIAKEIAEKLNADLSRSDRTLLFQLVESAMAFRTEQCVSKGKGPCASEIIEQAITADRSQLQAEIEKGIELIRCGFHAQTEWVEALNEASRIIQSIFSQSSPAESKPSLDGYDPKCPTCNPEQGSEAKEVAKEKSAKPDRIAVLHSLLGEQAETINQLLEENHALQKKLSSCIVRDDSGNPLQLYQCAL